MTKKGLVREALLHLEHQNVTVSVRLLCLLRIDALVFLEAWGFPSFVWGITLGRKEPGNHQGEKYITQKDTRANPWRPTLNVGNILIHCTGLKEQSWGEKESPRNHRKEAMASGGRHT